MRPALACSLLLAAAACGSDTPASPDGAGGPPDAGATPDATGAAPDASAAPDAGPAPDAAPPEVRLLPPEVACPAPVDACTAAPVDTALRASYRKDVYLPEYTETGTTNPTSGGRFHVAGVAAASGAVTAVRINGLTTAEALAQGKVEWWQVWPTTAVAGEPLWVAFHSRDAAWDSAASGTLTVETAGGAALSGTFAVARAPAPLTYVTTTDDLGATVIHVKNTDTAPRTLTSLFVDGRDVLATGAACVPRATLAPGETAMWTVPRCEAAQPGDAWTVAAVFDGGAASVGVGRVLPPDFPIQTWSKTVDCAFPGANDVNFQRHVAAGFDASFIRARTDYCGDNGVTITNTALTGTGFRSLITDVLNVANPGAALTNLDNVLGLFTGDEVDGELTVNGESKPELQAAETRTFWGYYPGRPTYQGGKTNHNVGTFAGAADIQGMDFYVAACAPHITPFGTHPPLRAAYDYLRNTRNNHMPLPTWLYAQGLSDVWNKTGLLGGVINVQPDPQEIDVQAMSVMAAGGKGLMWFQTQLAEADHAPARWEAIADANWTFRAVRRELRLGDVTGLASTGGAALVEAVRGRDAIVVPVINLDVQTAPTDLGCGGAFVSEASVPHWILKAQTLDVTVAVPADFGVDEIFEIVDGEVVDVPAGSVTVAGRAVKLTGVALSNATPTRVFVLAANPEVRTAMAAAGTR